MFLANIMKKFLRNYLEDLFLLAGCGCILVGLALWSPIATWIIAGLMLIGFGVLIGLEKSKHVIE
jgi:hypothetical protein